MTPALLPLLRLARSRTAWLAAGGWGAFALVSAWQEHHEGAAHGATLALDALASVALPLLVYGVVAAAAPDGLALSGRPLVRLGAPPLRVALATVGWAMVISALVSGVIAAAAVALAHGASDPPWHEDAVASLGYVALAGAAYAAYFMLGSSLIARAWGRAALLVVDWVLGSDDGLGALFTPRAHLRNVLGGEAPFDALAWQSLCALAVIAVVCAALAAKQAARSRV